MAASMRTVWRPKVHKRDGPILVPSHRKIFVHKVICVFLKVLGKSVGLCKTTKRKDQLYISLLVSVWRIICRKFQPKQTHIS